MTINKELARIDALIEARDKATQRLWEIRSENKQLAEVVVMDGDWDGGFYKCATAHKTRLTKGNGDFIALAANELKPLLENYKRALDVVQYYADSTNFEAVNNGRNYHDEWVVEEYNKHTVSGDDMGSAARAFLQSLEQNENN